ncbi:biotin--[acetyl-CoA-carboxylase] ligase [Boudabousia marimammalium]|uniref:Biotin--[acetyl-CoA-carboxylase] ligase n=1 Tax=Boudabousia marimammalium TaxID=156892 RepID=A0A1Q5PNW4_9ACTO|nr:biotin--[acetyl-CoA-carboxylase] ligase [Boudabousia marimammalium]OKL49278.1 biotin--[acetyl-CoA-carboxylase] ligase [Boudabousia marimammalium]
MTSETPRSYHYQLIDSTQSEAGRLLGEYTEHRAGPLFTVTAHAQTKGRGRFNRTWNAAPGTCSLSTIVVRIPGPFAASAPWLTALGAIAAAQIVREAFPALAGEVTLKWPNDLQLSGKKFGGVIATALNQITADTPWVDVACGIGVNTTMTAAQLPVSAATSLQVELEKRGFTAELSTEQLRGQIIERVLVLVTRWQEKQWDAHASGLAAQYRQSLDTLGKTVIATVLTEAQPRQITGILTDLTDCGHALIATTAGEELVSAGDVTLRTPQKFVTFQEAL